MPDAFFASTSRKRKRQSAAAAANKPGPTDNKAGRGPSGSRIQKRHPPPRRKPAAAAAAPRRDEEIDSDATRSDIDDLRASDGAAGSDGEEEDAHETPAQKRLRLAKIYLDGLKEDLSRAEGEVDAAEIDKEIISARLKQDVLEHAGKVHIFITETLATDPPPRRLRVKGHRLAVTSAVLSHDARRLYTAGKEGSISSWDVATGKRLSSAPKVMKDNGSHGHSDEVLALALSGDGKYLASGGKDRTVGVWEVSGDGDGAGNTERDGKSKELAWVKGFRGHKDTISALSFRKATNTLYTASHDRTLKIFDLSPTVLGYVETLFGHQDSVADLDSLRGDTAVSCGGRDRTCRFWKIADETQLVFRGGGAGRAKGADALLESVMEDGDLGAENAAAQEDGKKKDDRWIEGSVDCVAMVDETHFISGGDSGTLSLWSTGKKKPIFTHAAAHGVEELHSSTEGALRRPRWITTIACLRYSDLFATGSWDGCIRLWKLDSSLRSFVPAGRVPALGVINSLELVLMPKDWSCDDGWTDEALNNTGGATNNDVVGEPLNGGGVNGAASRVFGKARADEGVLLVAGVGREPRLGRWMTVKDAGAKNSAVVFSLRKKVS